MPPFNDYFQDMPGISQDQMQLSSGLIKTTLCLFGQETKWLCICPYRIIMRFGIQHDNFVTIKTKLLVNHYSRAWLREKKSSVAFSK